MWKRARQSDEPEPSEPGSESSGSNERPSKTNWRRTIKTVVSSLTGKKAMSPSPVNRKTLERCGLFTLHPTPSESSEELKIDVDIVAIHGLGGDARKTWTDQATGKLWLQDFLPTTLPNARIMTFGYDATWVFASSIANLDDFALDLLDRLLAARRGEEAQKRPLVFVCHSLGGIVLKKALILAHESNKYYGDISESTKGILFLGTPHRGSNLASWGSILSRLANTLAMSSVVRNDLLCGLEIKSESLQSVSRQFVQRASSLHIISFYERIGIGPLSTLTVDQESSTMGIVNERIIPIMADHRSMAFFSDPTSQVYLPVEQALLQIVSIIKESERPLILASNAVSDLATLNLTSSDTIPPSITPYMTPSISRSTNDTPSSSQLTDAQAGDWNERSPPNAFIPRIDTLDIKSERDDSISPFNASENDVQQFRGSQPSENLLIRFLNLQQRLSIRGVFLDYNSQVDIELPRKLPIDELNKILYARGYNTIRHFKFPESSIPISPVWFDIFTEPVTVSSAQSLANGPEGLRINEDETLASFFSRIHPSPVQIDLITDGRRNGKGVPSSTYLKVLGEENSLAGKTLRSPGVEISFKRTVRVPANGELYKLPPDLGNFPLFNVAAFGDRLPQEMIAKGGVFFPIYQREAMWMSFKNLKTQARHIIRPFVGGVNAISGEPLVGDMTTLLRRANSVSQKQDYLVLPEQPWMDGISTSPGVVKQFVATPMLSPRQQERRRLERGKMEDPKSDPKTPEFELGGSIELQVTGNDRSGGLQLGIIPEHNTKRMSFSSKPNDWVIDNEGSSRWGYQFGSSGHLEVFKTPHELGMAVGDTIHMKDLEHRKDCRPKLLEDLLLEMPDDAKSPEGMILLQTQSLDSWELKLFITCEEETGVKPFEIEVQRCDHFKDLLILVENHFKTSTRCPFSLHLQGAVQQDASVCIVIGDFEDCFQFSSLAVNHDPQTQNKPGKIERQSLNLIWAPTSCGVKPLVLHIRPQGPQMHNPFNTGKPLLIASQLDQHRDQFSQIRRTIELETRKSLFDFVLEWDENTSNQFLRLNPADKAVAQVVYIDTAPGYPLMIELVTLTGKNFIVIAYSRDTVEGLKTRVFKKLGIPEDQQRLISDGKQLETGRLLSDYMINNGTRLFLVLRLRGGGGGLTVFMDNGADYTTTCEGTVRDAKRRLSIMLEVPISKIDLLVGNRVLSDDSVLYDVVYKSRYSLRMIIRDEHFMALSLGAGGSIKQFIQRDGNNPRIWDTTSAKLINIQMINAALFEYITGLATPSTPVTYQTYASAGLPFYDIYRERPSSISGAFSDVKTVLEIDQAQDLGDVVTDLDSLRSSRCSDCGLLTPNIVFRPCKHCLCDCCARKTSRDICPTCGGQNVTVVRLTAPLDEGQTEPAASVPVVLLNMDGYPDFQSIVDSRS